MKTLEIRRLGQTGGREFYLGAMSNQYRSRPHSSKVTQPDSVLEILDATVEPVGTYDPTILPGDHAAFPNVPGPGFIFDGTTVELTGTVFDTLAVEFTGAIFTSPETPLTKFVRLREEWEDATAFMSSVHMFMNDSYLQIIGMGVTAIPFILQDLKDEGGEWFWALRSITGEDPAEGAPLGNTEAHATAWIDWGEEHGFLDA